MIGDIIINFLNYYLIIGFVGSIFAGETIIIPLGFFSGQNLINPFLAFFVCYLGVLLADTIWFSIGSSKKLEKIVEKTKFFKDKKLPTKIQKALQKTPISSMCFIKFLYGFRIISIIYMGHKHKSLKDFSKALFTSNLLGVGVPFLLAFLIGVGLKNYFNIFNSLRLFFTSFFIVFIFIYILKKLISKWIIKRKDLKI